MPPRHYCRARLRPHGREARQPSFEDHLWIRTGFIICGLRQLLCPRFEFLRRRRMSRNQFWRCSNFKTVFKVRCSKLDCKQPDCSVRGCDKSLLLRVWPFSPSPSPCDFVCLVKNESGKGQKYHQLRGVIPPPTTSVSNFFCPPPPPPPMFDSCFSSHLLSRLFVISYPLPSRSSVISSPFPPTSVIVFFPPLPLYERSRYSPLVWHTFKITGSFHVDVVLCKSEFYSVTISNQAYKGFIFQFYCESVSRFKSMRQLLDVLIRASGFCVQIWFFLL